MIAKINAHLLVALLCWTATGNLIRTIDGDTFIASINIWHQLWSIERVRVLDIDTPERKGLERERGDRAREFTLDWLKQGDFSLDSCKRDSFGRILAKVYRGTGASENVLADELRKAGHVK